MVAFGGLRYRQAAAGLGITAAEAAALLRSAPVKAAAARPGSLPAANQQAASP
jgi:hypothetical protein